MSDLFLRRVAQEVINDVEAVQSCGEEDVRETWPDLWATYELACEAVGVKPRATAADYEGWEGSFKA